MPRLYQTPNYGVSNEPPTHQEEAIRRMEEHEAGLRSQPRPNIHEESETRLAHFLDEDDHTKCVNGNKQALQSEKLERLRALKEDTARTNWMFMPNSTVTSFSGWKTGS
ncbi:hypothetical protein ACHAWO_005178 [Cyclotella atomus]|uniref:Uncharacterized protein n=1 Tax=Cyclotella atomus TaxID=382360 RepID=A0ABD3N5A8_9STRA